MDVPLAYYLSALCVLAFWGLLFFYGARARMLQRYRLFYAFAAVSALCYVTKWIGSQTLTPYPDYFFLYIGAAFVQASLAAALLVQIYLISHRPKSLAALVVPLVIAGMIFADTPVWKEFQVYIRLTNSLYAFVTVLGGIVLFRLILTRDLIVGANYYSILGGLLFPHALYALNHLAYFSKLPWWPVSVFAHLGEPVFVLSWLVILAGMRRYDPPRWIATHRQPPGDGEAEVLLKG